MRGKKRSFENDRSGGKSSTDSEYNNSIPRSGKWTAEEENFAFRLIREFESGTLVDCEDGCTLRSYLARKLNCAPMRISKKFAGKCIGKHTFTRKPGATTVEPSWLAERGIDLPRHKIPRMSDFTMDSRSCSPTSRISYCSESPKLEIRGDHVTNGEIGGESMFLQYRQAYGSASFPSFDQFFIQQDHCDNNDQLTISSTIEAVEWMEVLSYFCAPNLSSNEIEDISRPIPRNISFNSLFRD